MGATRRRAPEGTQCPPHFAPHPPVRPAWHNACTSERPETNALQAQVRPSLGYRRGHPCLSACNAIAPCRCPAPSPAPPLWHQLHPPQTLVVLLARLGPAIHPGGPPRHRRPRHGSHPHPTALVPLPARHRLRQRTPSRQPPRPARRRQPRRPRCRSHCPQRLDERPLLPPCLGRSPRPP